jgi:co-chaperonin GroES (HSP10)
MKINPSKIKPIHNWVLIKCEGDPSHEQITSAGIVIPESIGHTEQTVGTVVAVGPGAYHHAGQHKGKFVKMQSSPGDRVLFAQEGAVPIPTDDGYHYELVRETHILGTL